jgi:predicted DCC family thiol-disulfide oxidoreductase YuxK
MASALYSWRLDPTVPDFDDSFKIVFMDGDCALCSRSARWIAKLDKQAEFKICPIQSPLGQAVLLHHGLDPKDPDSWLLLDEGQAFTSFDAIMRTGQRLGGVGTLVLIFRPLPRRLRQGLYQLLARNRYRWFGKADLCALPDEERQKRLIR